MCTRCGAQAEAARNLNQLVRNALPPVHDDPALRASIMAGVRARAEQSAAPTRAATRAPAARGYQWAALATAGLLLAFAVVWRQPALEAAGHGVSRFAELVNAPDATTPRVAPAEQGPPGERLGLPGTPAAPAQREFEAIVPATLPHGLRLEGISRPSPEVLFARYKDERGGHYLIIQRPWLANAPQFDPANTSLRVVSGLEVLVEENQLTGSVSRAYWVLDGLHVELSVTVELPPGLSVADMEAIVAAFMAAEDDTGSVEGE